MADNNYNMIQPVENLQNVGGLTPVKREKERKRRQNSQEENEQEQQEQNDAIKENAGSNGTKTKSDRHSIDYRAWPDNPYGAIAAGKLKQKMKKPAGNILKSSDVKFEGSFHLDVEPADSATPQQKNLAHAPPQVHIVENHPDFAVLEITCSCGTKSYLRCEYNNRPSASHEPEQTKTNEENNNAN